jgi:hypothetical protein
MEDGPDKQGQPVLPQPQDLELSQGFIPLRFQDFAASNESECSLSLVRP